MNISLSLVRALFLMMSILFLTTYTTTIYPGGLSFANLTIGVVGGLLFGMFFISFELLLKKINLYSFNVCTLGLFCGYLMGEAIMLIFQTALNLSTFTIASEASSLIRIAVFLSSIYIAMVMVLRASEGLQIAIPFVTFNSATQKKKDIVLDASTLFDTRIIDLATSGLLDGILIMPKFVIKELNYTNENGDETAKAKTRRCLEVVRKLEGIPSLEMRYDETDYPELKDAWSKICRLADMRDASIMTADLNRAQYPSSQKTRIINIHTLSNALKPISQNGEFLNIKIQRYGKEPRQGVGYLEDGTMVVVNGGAEYIGETIKAQVLSVKHTSSGRMIFCNTTDEHLLHEQEISQAVAEMENSHKNYFAL